MIDTSKLSYILDKVQYSRRYFAHADTDEEQALASLMENQADLLEEMAGVILDIAKEISTGEE